MNIYLFDTASVRTGFWLSFAILAATGQPAFSSDVRVYKNELKPVANPQPILADYPDYVEPIRETNRFEAPVLVDDKDADLNVRAWRFSYNARAIIEMPNRLRARDTALIMVHPWGTDDSQGWKTPEPAGAADFCTPDKNHLAGRHTREVVDPFLKSLRGKVGLVMYSLPGHEDPVRKKLYRSFRSKPDAAEREEGARELHAKLSQFTYRGEALPAEIKVSGDKPVIDYFAQFHGLDAGSKYDPTGFWDMPIPVTSDLTVDPNDVVIYDEDGYPALRKYLEDNGIRHVLLTGYCTDMCYEKTTAGFVNLSHDFDVFLVGDATLATFPASPTPRFATSARVSFASLDQLITQISWIRYELPAK
jgi:nicotinamidase-related amidase